VYILHFHRRSIANNKPFTRLPNPGSGLLGYSHSFILPGKQLPFLICTILAAHQGGKNITMTVYAADQPGKKQNNVKVMRKQLLNLATNRNSYPVVTASDSRNVALRVVLGFCLLMINNSGYAAGHPDLTGVWGMYQEPGQPRPSFRAPPPELPYTTAGKQKVDAYRALVAPTGDSPGGWCLGYGMPASMLGSGGYPMEIVQHDDVIIVVYEAHAEIRHIYMKLRVADKDLFSDRNGYSIGHWQGNRLIVETSHLKEAVDQRRYPHSANARIVEEYELTTTADGKKVLVAHMTMTDPDFYTETITTDKKWTYLPDTRLLSYECNEPNWEEHLQSLQNQQERAGN